MLAYFVNYALKIASEKQVTAEVMLVNTISSSVTYRERTMETFMDSAENNLTLRILYKNKRASISTNSLNEKNIYALIERGIEMAESSPEDVDLKTPLTPPLPNAPQEITPTIDKTWLINTAKQLEEESLNYAGVTNTNGATAAATYKQVTFANTNNFFSSYTQTIYALAVEVIAGAGQQMQSGDDYCLSTLIPNLISPEVLGQKAAHQAVESLNPRKVATTKVPVFFDPKTATSLIKTFANAVNGSAVVSKSTFLIDKLNEQIFSPEVNIIDDPQMEEGIASRPFDDEGVATQKLFLVEKGILKSWLLDTYHANKLGLKSTGHAKQSRGMLKPEYTNLYLAPGSTSLEDLMATVNEGLYITQVLGFGVNLMTGDYSQGARGFWIKNGKIAYPVAEITIAGNLLEMFSTLKVANDLKMQYYVNSPTVLIPEMTVAGT